MKVCEAMLKIDIGERFVYAGCGDRPVERHHRLTRARGGVTLDEAGEEYHIMYLCPKHHRLADGGDARAGGLVIDGYVTGCSNCGTPFYQGPDEYLTEKYGSSVHVQCVRGLERRAVSSEGL